MTEEFEAQVDRIAALGEPVRRQLYRYVVAQDRPVGRERAAEGTGVAHHVAKFHLDRLVAEGLLDVEYARPPGRNGPGAGRPAKLYRRSGHDISVSLPDRRYDLAGRVMAEAITAATRTAIPVGEALRAAARSTGRALGAEPLGAEALGADPVQADPVAAISAVLARHGYEPRSTGDGVILANCPFHSLAAAYTELVCGINLDLIDGVLDTLCPQRLCARLDPGPDRCCVTIGPPQR